MPQVTGFLGSFSVCMVIGALIFGFGSAAGFRKVTQRARVINAVNKAIVAASIILEFTRLSPFFSDFEPFFGKF